MECKEFQKKINDFIFDKMNDSSEIEDFLKHYKNCADCKDELRLYYVVRRGLGDVESPMEEEVCDAKEELDTLISYYEDLFRMQKIRRRVFTIMIFAIAIALLMAIGLIMLDI